jgi:1,2-diacylglycerol 3-alpha-glucosyltransferase
MRILMISDVYFPRINGVSTSIMTFRREFQASGHEVTLIAPDYGHGDEPDADIIRIPSRYVVVDPEDRMLRAGHIRRLTEELRSRHFDILHIQTPFIAHYTGLTLAKRLGLPRVESYHTFFEEYLYNYISFLPKAWLRFAARRFSASQCNNVDGLVVPSSAMLDVLRSYGVRTRAEVIPTGIELMRFRNGSGQVFRQRYNIPEDRPTLVHVGRIAHEKNIDFLLRALVHIARRMPDVLLIIAGEGPALKHLRRLAAELGMQNNVLFVGYLSRDKGLLDCYCAGDAFVFASRTETQGLVLLEAMALGVPVVSTAVMGTRDILAPGKGAMVAHEDEEDFAAKALAVLGDRGLRARLSTEAHEYARAWSAEALASRMLDFYQEVTGLPAAARAVAASG